MSRFLRPCLERGCPNLAHESRCPEHQRARAAVYKGAWPAISATALRRWRAAHGDWCPGYETAPHPSADLTVDHVAPRSLAAGVAVLCRACNGRKADR